MIQLFTGTSKHLGLSQFRAPQNPTEVKLVSEGKRKTGYNWNVEEYVKREEKWFRYQYQNSGFYLKYDRDRKKLIIGKQMINICEYKSSYEFFLQRTRV